MSTEKIIGRGAYGGVAEGIALVVPDSIQGWAGIDDRTGIIIERDNSHTGECIHGKILVLPCAKGSNGWSSHFHAAKVCGISPVGWIFTKMDSRCGVGATVMKIPTVADFTDVNPCEFIHDGDYVRINGQTGEVEILHRAE